MNNNINDIIIQTQKSYIFPELNKQGPRTLFDTREVAGSAASIQQSGTVCSCVVSLFI